MEKNGTGRELVLLVSDENLLQASSEEDINNNTYTVWHSVGQKSEQKIRLGTFEDVLKYVVGNVEGTDAGEREVMDAIRGHYRVHDGVSSLLTIFTYDGNRQRMPGVREFGERTQGNIFPRIDRDDQGSADYDCLEMVVTLVQKNGFR